MEFKKTQEYLDILTEIAFCEIMNKKCNLLEKNDNVHEYNLIDSTYEHVFIIETNKKLDKIEKLSALLYVDDPTYFSHQIWDEDGELLAERIFDAKLETI